MDKDILPPRNPVTDDTSVAEATKTSTVSTRRRRLIKASAAAVPTILTLRSGAAAAIASMDCRDVQAATVRAEEIAINKDAWVRIPGYPARRLYADGTVYYYLKEIDKFYNSNGDKLNRQQMNDTYEAALESSTPNCFFVNKEYTLAQTCVADNTEGWACAFLTGATASKEDVAEGTKFERALYEHCGENIPAVQLLAFFTWFGNEICGVTYAPLDSVVDDVVNIQSPYSINT